MPVKIPPELKKITPYVRRAEELDKDQTNAESRLVAYYCRQYAVHLGIPLATSPPGKDCLGELLNHLEEEKRVMAAFNRDEAKFLCAKFADKIFDKADQEDRSGQATKGTAKTFYAGASFLEILHQFYKDDDDSEELEEIKKKAVYAKWKATDILKALKEGRSPTPGGYGEEATTDAPEEEGQPGPAVVETVTNDDGEESVEDPAANNEPDAPVVRLPSTDNHDESVGEDNPEKVPEAEEEEEEEETPPEDEGTEVELGPPPAFDNFVPPPSAPPAAVVKPPLSFTPAPTPPPMPPPPLSKPLPPPPVPAPAPPKKTGGIFGFGKKKKSGKFSKAEFKDAMELTKFALAAMEEKDADLATQRLEQALAVMTRSSS